MEQRRKEQADREEAERLAAEEERRITAGITYAENLLAFEVAGEGDKITLPPSALESLTKQDALAQGPMLFQVSLVAAPTMPGARTSHVGVLEFSAEEGTVGLPLKVRKSLCGGEEKRVELGQVRVKYIRLEKGTYAKFQPRTAGLSQVPELKAMLEMNLHNHATLSVGDLLQVWFRGKCFDLRVVELEPDPAVTVIDTDLTVDVDVPEEQPPPPESAPSAASGAAASKQVSPPRTLGGSTLGGSSSGSTSSAAAPAAAPPSDEEERRRAGALAALAPEPADGDADVVSLLIRKPDGSMVARRFGKAQPFADVFAFVDATSPSSSSSAAGAYRLVTRFPRRLFTPEETGQQSVGEALGANVGKKETLMYESVAAM